MVKISHFCHKCNFGVKTAQNVRFQPKSPKLSFEHIDRTKHVISTQNGQISLKTRFKSKGCIFGPKCDFCVKKTSQIVRFSIKTTKNEFLSRFPHQTRQFGLKQCNLVKNVT